MAGGGVKSERERNEDMMKALRDRQNRKASMAQAGFRGALGQLNGGQENAMGGGAAGAGMPYAGQGTPEMAGLLQGQRISAGQELPFC